jgi:phosphatidylserine/phosphatidylglycerophosphate/cardiolipin synthase-like enzyme
MYQCWTEREAIIFSSEIVLYLIDDIGLICLVISSMNIDPSRFIHNHEICILIEDRERNSEIFIFSFTDLYFRF